MNLARKVNIIRVVNRLKREVSKVTKFILLVAAMLLVLAIAGVSGIFAMALGGVFFIISLPSLYKQFVYMEESQSSTEPGHQYLSL